MKEPVQDPMLTVNEVCAQLGIGRSKFYDLVRKGELKAVNVNPAAKRHRFIGQKGPRPSIRVAQSEVSTFKERNAISTA